MISKVERERIAEKHGYLKEVLNERQLRVWAAIEARTLGHGGIMAVSGATGMGRRTIWQGIEELEDGSFKEEPSRIRRPGAGRPTKAVSDPTLVEDLDRLIEPTTRGDPVSPLRWSCKSTEKLAEALKADGHSVSARTVGGLLVGLGYSLQAPSKQKEGKQHPDRNDQFEYINAQTISFHEAGLPVISVDTKRKELVGNFRNPGREWMPEGEPIRVNVHDFPSDALGKAIPYGVYDIFLNTGWVNVGINHDTAEFAANSILTWWREMGSHLYPNADRVMIVADSGGSNSPRTRLWKKSIQEIADTTDMMIDVCHFPPGTSKWNKIEHRMFSHISMNWRGRPLTSYETIVQLIANTSTREGLTLGASLDERLYQTGVKVTDEELMTVCHFPHQWHGEWNYTIMPRRLCAN